MTAGAARILELLRDAPGRRLSGEVLSRELGVSRARIWKHVEALRGLGYRIEGTPGGGYHLVAAPDRLYPEEVQRGLGTRWLARIVHHFECLDSTNSRALDLARAGAPHGTLVIAEAQTAGRGRLGRSFFSPPHRSLYASVVLRPALSLAEAPTLVLASAVAVAEAVAAEAGPGLPVRIKWPNDVLLAGRKTSGILMELGAEGARVDHVVMGIGVNLNLRRSELPEEFRDRATSLAAELGRPVDRVAFTRRLLGHLEEVLDTHAGAGFEALRSRFEARSALTGRPVRVEGGPGEEITGTALGLDRDGALLVAPPGGPPRRVLAGDVTLVREATPASAEEEPA